MGQQHGEFSKNTPESMVASVLHAASSGTIDRATEDPRLIYFNDGHTSDDEGADEDERDPEEDAELICRPRTTGKKP